MARELMQDQNLITGDEQKELLEKRIKNAERVLRDLLKVKAGEKVAFVTDKNEYSTDQELISILKQILERDKIDFSELVADDEKTTEAELFKAVRGHDLVWISWGMEETDINFDKLSGSITEKQGRMLFAPGLKAEHLDDGSALTEDKEELDCRLAKMEAKLKDVAGFHITSVYGTDLKIKMMPGKRKWQKENGELNPGSWGNLPGGDIFAVPDEENINGVMVLPILTEEVAKHQGVDEFVRLEIRGGKIAKIDGGKSAEKLRKYLQKNSKYEENPESVIQITDIGFGANSKAKPMVAKESGRYTDTPNPSVEAFNHLGTMHIGTGSSQFDIDGVEGHTVSDIHLDFVLPRNGLTVNAFYSQEDFKKGKNGERLIDEGRWRMID